eukprot:14291295-Ditylum_brightwellii.AAC.1
MMKLLIYVFRKDESHLLVEVLMVKASRINTGDMNNDHFYGMSINPNLATSPSPSDLLLGAHKVGGSYHFMKEKKLEELQITMQSLK